MKQIIFSILMLCSMAILGQNEVKEIVIAIAGENDTLYTKHFDASNNLIFAKTYPKYSYGIGQIS